MRVSGFLNVMRADSLATRRAAHVEKRLIRAVAGEIDRAVIVERRRRHLVRGRERSVADSEFAAVGQRPANVQGSSFRPRPDCGRRTGPVLSRVVATVFVPADSKERSDESVIELTVPIEAEATSAPGGGSSR